MVTIPSLSRITIQSLDKARALVQDRFVKTNSEAGEDFFKELAAQEDYKKSIHDKANELLTEKLNAESSAAEAYQIFLELISPKISDNILVAENKYGTLINKIDAYGRDRFARQFAKLYTTDDDKLIFENILKATGSYAATAYLFFIKDRTKYLPIRSTQFDHAFAFLLGEKIFKTSGKGSWENYLEFIKYNKQVHAWLKVKTDKENPELLDAHSFLWQLGMALEDKAKAKKSSDADPDKPKKAKKEALADAAMEMSEAEAEPAKAKNAKKAAPALAPTEATKPAKAVKAAPVKEEAVASSANGSAEKAVATKAAKPKAVKK